MVYQKQSKENLRFIHMLPLHQQGGIVSVNDRLYARECSVEKTCHSEEGRSPDVEITIKRPRRNRKPAIPEI